MKSWLIWKDPGAGKDWRREEKGLTEDEMVGWHHQLSGYEFLLNSGSWTGRPGVLQFMGSQRVGHNWATELNWTHTHRGGMRSSIHFIAWHVLVKCERKVFLVSSHIFGCVCVCVLSFVDCRNYNVVMSRLFKLIFLKRTITVNILRTRIVFFLNFRA